ncbi:MAG: hypothetical protein IJX04_07745 [Oscillospiraceae bacterium]|nr:hypothetical protein [Oscillospiraceae bacterium]
MRTRKLKLSHYWWANFWFLFGVMLTAEVGFLLLAGEILWIPVVLIALMFLIGAFHPWRFLMTMEVREGVFRFFLFGRLCCQVYTDRPVYYALLEFDEHFSINKPYIAISNHPFRVRPRQTDRMPLRSDRFIDYYDRNAVILFPRNPQTEGLFPLERWHRVN